MRGNEAHVAATQQLTILVDLDLDWIGLAWIGLKWIGDLGLGLVTKVGSLN